MWPTKKCKMFKPTCHFGCLFWFGMQHGPELGASILGHILKTDFGFGFFVVLFLACLVFWIDFCYIFGTNFEQTVDIHFEWFLIIFGNISWLIFVRANMLRDAIGDWQYHRSYKIWEYNFWFYRTLHRLKRRFLSTEKLNRIICCKLFYFTMIIKNT